MTDHESFVLLAAKQISEPLTAEEEAELAAHLAACPECRSTAAVMRRHGILLRAELGTVNVSPRVRRRVLDEAVGRRRFDPRLILGLAAALLLAGIGVPLIIGAASVADPSPSVPTQPPTLARTLTPDPSPASSPSLASPSAVAPESSASPSPSGPFVIGNYVYGTSRRDTLAAHFEEGRAVGEWSRRSPATGDSSDFFAGPVTCLVISGSDAWLAGPATTATDGTTKAAFIHVTDGGPSGERDTAFLWQAKGGQTIVTMTEWCEKRFIPGDGLPLTSGDVIVHEAPE